MDESFYLPGLSHFENENNWSGSSGLLCYEVEPPSEHALRAVTWCGPFCRDYAKEVGEALFPLSEDGLAQLKTWLISQARDMNEQPTETPESARAYYENLHNSD